MKGLSQTLVNGDFQAIPANTGWNACCPSGGCTEILPLTSYGGMDRTNYAAELDGHIDPTDIRDDRVLCQEISCFEVGATYRIILEASRRGTFSPPDTVSIHVEVDGTINHLLRRTGEFQMKEDSIYFIATKQTHTLSLKPTFTGFFGMIVDNIRLEKVEPSHFLGADSVLCEGQTLLLKAGETNSFQQWGDGGTDNTFLVEEEGTYWIELERNGCVYRDSIQIIYKTSPKVNLGNDSTLCFGEEIRLMAEHPRSSYLWSDGSTDSIRSISQPGFYFVEVHNTCGIARDSVQIHFENCVLCKVQIPNAFSPNNDFFNDSIGVSCNCTFKEYSLLIYDRKGRIAYQTKDPESTWDGRINGISAQRGTYFYTLNYALEEEKGIPKLQKGMINLLR